MKDVIRKVLGFDDEAPSAAAVEPPAAAPVLPDAFAPTGEPERGRRRLDPIAEHAADFVAYVHPSCRILEVSDSGLAFTGHLESQVVDASIAKLVHGEDAELVVTSLATAVRTGRAQVAFRMIVNAGNAVWMKATMVRMDDVADDGPAVALIAHDMTEQRAAEERLMQMATRDPLTGLANRALLSERLAQVIAQARRTGGGFTLLMLDLDGFKKVNDTLGHAVGDELLRAAAGRIAEVVRETDSVARQGGDEFVCLLPGATDPAGVETVASRLLGAIQWPFEVGDFTLHMTTSIGAAIYPQHGTDEATLMKHADRAMYRAKEAGRNTWTLFSADLSPQTERTLSLESAMHDAIAAGEFVLHYQPIGTMDRRVVGCEALMRWQRGDNSSVAPGEFIPLAESNGLIKILGAWALRAVCAQLAQWSATAGPEFYGSVNVSPRQFRQSNFVKVVRQALELTGLPPSRLVIEITEGVIMQNPQASQRIVTELRDLGVRIAVDDFGTGYSSLAYLKNFPLNAIKIDRSFVRDVVHGRKDAAIVSAVITLARDLGMDVVAEGVEEEEQRAILESKGCAFMQGWLLGRGVDAASFHAAHLASGGRKLAIAA